MSVSSEGGERPATRGAGGATAQGSAAGVRCQARGGESWGNFRPAGRPLAGRLHPRQLPDAVSAGRRQVRLDESGFWFACFRSLCTMFCSKSFYTTSTDRDTIQALAVVFEQSKVNMLSQRALTLDRLCAQVWLLHNDLLWWGRSQGSCYQTWRCCMLLYVCLKYWC